MAPDFTASTTEGPLTLSDYKGQWVVLFAYPSDFSPVCATELIALARLAEEYKAINSQLIGISVDGIQSHIAWLYDLEERFGIHVPFPIIADAGRQVARAYDLLDEATATTLRAVLIIDPTGRMRFSAFYPAEVGRKMDEILRVVRALQIADAEQVATPCNWEPGDPAILPPPTTAMEAERRVAAGAEHWYILKKSL